MAEVSVTAYCSASLCAQIESLSSRVDQGHYAAHPIDGMVYVTSSESGRRMLNSQQIVIVKPWTS